MMSEYKVVQDGVSLEADDREELSDEDKDALWEEVEADE